MNMQLFGDAIAAEKAPAKPLGRSGFMRGAKIALPVIPPPRQGVRRVRVVDSFAGGGGATNGIRRALERLHGMDLLPSGHDLDVTYAINHDEPALAMHQVNHPDTIHLPHNVWKVSMHDLLGDDLFGLLWLSPDCRDHSPAKGGPITSRSVRDLAWVLLRWLKELPDWQRPWNIYLENVPAFSQWSPLVDLPEGGFKRDETRLGEVFHRYLKAVCAFGYSAGWQELSACDYGDPTIRKRLHLVFRRDGARTEWPKPTHAAPKSDAVKSGALKPWPVAADIIDFERPCPSIFLTKEEAAAYTKATGVRIIRPLAFKSDARIAKGVKRHVLDTAEPCIVTLNHGGEGFRGQGLQEPLRTVTSSRDAHGLVIPSLAAYYGDGSGSTDRSASINEPLRTVPTAPRHALLETAIAPFLSHAQHGGRSRPVGEPVHTIAASTKDQNQVIAAYLAQHNGGSRGPIGRSAEEPLSSVTVSGSQQQVVAAHMLSLKGSDRRDGSCNVPHPSICASGQHSAVVTLPLMTAYYSTGGQHAAIDAPMLTVPTKARFGLTEVSAAIPPLSQAQIARARQVADFLRLHGCWDEREFVTLSIGAVVYIIVDIGMRMLTPRELARAQGFPDSHILAAPYKGGFLSETEQRHKIGNSVCEGPASAVIEANYRPPLEWGEYYEAFREVAA